MGLRDPSVLGLPIVPDMTAIFWYNGLQLLASLAIGLIVTRLVAQAEREPSQARAVLAVIVAGFVITIVAIGLLTTPIRALLPWWSIVVANSVAVVLAGSYLLLSRLATGPSLNPYGCYILPRAILLLVLDPSSSHPAMKLPPDGSGLAFLSTWAS